MMGWAWKGLIQRAERTLQILTSVGPGPNGDRLDGPKCLKQLPSAALGHLGAHQVLEEPESADGVSSILRSHYHHHLHPHWNTNSLNHLKENTRCLDCVQLQDYI